MDEDTIRIVKNILNSYSEALLKELLIAEASKIDEETKSLVSFGAGMYYGKELAYHSCLEVFRFTSKKILEEITK